MKRRLAKLAALLTVLVLLPVCALPETANTPEDQTNIIIEKKTFPHLWCYNKKDGGKVSEGEMNLYFMDGGDIPYVALSEYMDFLSRLYSEVKKADIAYEIGVRGRIQPVFYRDPPGQQECDDCQPRGTTRSPLPVTMHSARSPAAARW